MEVRLIDANALLDKCESLYMRGNVLFHGVTAYRIENAPTIDPESLPIVQVAKAMCREMVKENKELSKELDVSRRRSGDLSRELEQTKIELESMRTAANSLKMHLDSAEARCATLDKLVKEYQEQLIPGYRERAEKAERERDEAVKLIKRFNDETGNCYGCRYFDDKKNICTDKEKRALCDCGTNNMWEWRGPQKED